MPQRTPATAAAPMKKGWNPFGAPAFPTSHASYKPVRTGDHRFGQPVGARVVRQVSFQSLFSIRCGALPTAPPTGHAPARAPVDLAPPVHRVRPPRGKARSDSGGINTPKKCAATPCCRWSWSGPPWPGCGPFGGAGRGPLPSRTCHPAAQHCAAQSHQARGPNG